jgi:hypothetical protein
MVKQSQHFSLHGFRFGINYAFKASSLRKGGDSKKFLVMGYGDDARFG